MGRLLLAVATLLAPLLARSAAAQTPFPVYDPFYFRERARPGYERTAALTGTVAVRVPGSGAPSALTPPDLSTALRLDVRLGPALDVGAVVAAAQGTGTPIDWAWATARYGWRTDAGSAQAFRLALDPGADANVGFPLVDLAFLSSNPPGSSVVTDLAIGVRRVQLGYQRYVPVATPDGAAGGAADGAFDVTLERAFGWEARAALALGYAFDAAGSNAYGALVAVRGSYDLQTTPSDPADSPARRRLQSSAAWVQAGVDVERPSVRLAPFVRVPLLATTREEVVPLTVTFGLDVTLR